MGSARKRCSGVVLHTFIFSVGHPRRGPGTHCLRMRRVPQKKMWGTGYHRILSIRCISRIRSPLTHRLLLLRRQNVLVLNNAHPNDRRYTSSVCASSMTPRDLVTMETTHARAVCTRPSPLLRRAWERGYVSLYLCQLVFVCPYYAYSQNYVEFSGQFFICFVCQPRLLEKTIV